MYTTTYVHILCVFIRIFELSKFQQPIDIDSEERAFQSSYITYESGINVYYSYSTCNSTAEDWFDYTADDIR